MREQIKAEAERVYTAEDLCSERTKGRWLLENREIQEFLNAVTTSRWFRRMFPDFKSITVGNARNRPYGEGRLDGGGALPHFHPEKHSPRIVRASRTGAFAWSQRPRLEILQHVALLGPPCARAGRLVRTAAQFRRVRCEVPASAVARSVAI